MAGEGKKAKVKKNKNYRSLFSNSYAYKVYSPVIFFLTFYLLPSSPFAAGGSVAVSIDSTLISRAPAGRSFNPAQRFVQIRNGYSFQFGFPATEPNSPDNKPCAAGELYR